MLLTGPDRLYVLYHTLFICIYTQKLSKINCNSAAPVLKYTRESAALRTELRCDMYIIGFCGGSSCGKSTAVNYLRNKFKENIALVAFDSYYVSRPDLVFEERKMINVDRPEAIDAEEIYRNLLLLREGKAIEQPVYSFETFLRENVTERTEPKPILLVDGIFSFYYEKIRELFDLKVFIDADVDVRLSRRILRDTEVRHRPLDYIIDQYFQKVKPMHEIYVEPYKKYADIIIPHNNNTDSDFRILESIVENVLQMKKY